MKGRNFIQWGNTYTPYCSSSIESLFTVSIQQILSEVRKNYISSPKMWNNSWCTIRLFIELFYIVTYIVIALLTLLVALFFMLHFLYRFWKLGSVLFSLPIIAIAIPLACSISNNCFCSYDNWKSDN